MDTVEYMRDIVLAAAFIAYRQTGSYRQAARLLGLPTSHSEIPDWLVGSAVPSDKVVHERYHTARELLQAGINAVEHRMNKFQQPPEDIQVVE